MLKLKSQGKISKSQFQMRAANKAIGRNFMISKFGLPIFPVKKMWILKTGFF